MNDAFFQPHAGRVACPARNSPTRRGSSWASSACSPLPPAATLSSRNTAPAAHDPRHDGVKLAVGHCYRLDLRGHQLRHRTVGEGRHEHDVTMLKRLSRNDAIERSADALVRPSTVLAEQGSPDFTEAPNREPAGGEAWTRLAAPVALADEGDRAPSASFRLRPAGLRQDVPKGRRVLLVYDRAALDFAFRKRCRHQGAVYFLSRVKTGMVYDWLDDRPLDTRDPRNRGVTQDRRILTRDGHRMRIIHYTEPEQGRAYEFLTNEPELPLGVLAELYRRRWEVEKVFDEVKNKLGQRQPWGTSLVAKAAQGQLVALTHNLLLIFEHRLERDHTVSNTAEDRRRAQTGGRTQAPRRAGACHRLTSAVTAGLPNGRLTAPAGTRLCAPRIAPGW